MSGRDGADCAHVVANLQSGWVRYGAGATHLTPTEILILRILCDKHGMSLSIGKIIGMLWTDPDEEPGDAYRVVRVMMCTLRQKLALIGLPSVIKTIRGVGYVASLGKPSDPLAELIRTHPDRALAHIVLLGLGVA